MEAIDQLLLLTEVAIALCGFAGIVSAFNQQREGKVTRGNAVGISLLVTLGLMAAFFAILPLILHSFHIREDLIWSISSGIMSVNYCVFAWFSIKAMKSVKYPTFSSKLAVLLGYFIMTSIVAINVLNALQIKFAGEFGPYFISLIWPLITAGYLFARLVIRPLWRKVPEHKVEVQ